jgi:prolyl-tRNA synthetase
VDPGRDFEAERADIRSVQAGDLTKGGSEIEIVPAIEVGNIFKLGTRYSEALGATYLDETGIEHPIVMGSYGIGPARIIAASVEQRADEKGISWPKSLSPWDLSLVPLSKQGEPERNAADDLYAALLDAGIEVLYDDRDANAGEKLTDAELIGCPLRVVVGKKSLAQGKLEVQVRSSGADEAIQLDGAVETIEALLADLG